MGLFKKLKNVFSGNIEMPDIKDDCLILASKTNSYIKLGKSLTVKPHFVAVFVAKGKVADVFTEGTYRLEVKTMPILARILKLTKPNKKGELPSKFSADLYFLSLKDFSSGQFLSTDYVVAKGKNYKNVKVKLAGKYSFQITSPVDFVEAMLTQYGLIRDVIAKDELSNWVGELAVRCVQKNKPNIELLYERATDCFKGLVDYENKELFDCGVKILNIDITKTIFPKKIYKKVSLEYSELHQKTDTETATTVDVYEKEAQKLETDVNNEKLLTQNNANDIYAEQDYQSINDDIYTDKNHQSMDDDIYADKNDQNNRSNTESQPNSNDTNNATQNGNIDNNSNNIYNNTIYTDPIKKSIAYKQCNCCGAFNPIDSKECFSCKTKF